MSCLQALTIESKLYHTDGLVARLELPDGVIVWVRDGGSGLIARTERGDRVARDREISRVTLGGMLIDARLQFRSRQAMPDEATAAAVA